MRGRTVPPVRRVVRRAAAQRNARRAVCFRGATCFRLCRAPARVPLPDGRRGAGSARASRPLRGAACSCTRESTSCHVFPRRDVLSVVPRPRACSVAGREARRGVAPCLPSVAWCGVLPHKGKHVVPRVPVARRAFGCAAPLRVFRCRTGGAVRGRPVPPVPRVVRCAPAQRKARRATCSRGATCFRLCSSAARPAAARPARRGPRALPRATAPRSRAAARGAASAPPGAARPAVRARRRRRPPPPRGRPRRPPCRRARRSGRRPAP